MPVLAVVLAAFAATCVATSAAEPPALATTPAASDASNHASRPAVSVDAGRRAYTSTCARCHGINLVTTSSAFYDLRTFPKAEKDRFVDSVTNGKRQMPAWGSILKPEVIESVWLYIGSVNGW